MSKRTIAHVAVSYVFCASLCATAQVDDPRLGPARTLDTLHRFEPPADRAAWETRASELRLRVRIAAGLEPEPLRVATNLRSFATIDRDGYTVENVAFESLDRVYVTGNLYRPKGLEPGTKVPGVLCPHGHWENGRLFERSLEDAKREIERGAERSLAGARYPLQARCAQLARMGCVVLMYDMVGYADSQQLAHGAGFGDVEAELHGLSAFGLQTWNSIRALDALESLPDVDPSRIGVTGASGGGTQTFVLTAIDERVTVAFPAVMVSSTMQGGCVCENASHLRIGTDNVELAALAAPRPLALTGANDWTKHIVEDGLPALKRVYSFFGAESNVEAWCYLQFDHNYNQVAREHMYAWFAEHLGLGVEGPIVEREFDPIAPADLRVFHDGNPRPPCADAAAIRQALRSTIETRPFAAARDIAERNAIADRMRAHLAVLLEHRKVDGDRVRNEANLLEPIAGQRRERWSLRDESSGHVVTATYLGVDDPEAIPMIVVGRDESQVRSTFGIDESFGPDFPLVVVDLLPAKDGAFVGRDQSRHRDYVGYSTGYNSTLVSERVRDLTIASSYVARRWRDVRSFVGLDDGAFTVLLARAVCNDADREVPVFLDLREVLRSIEAFEDTRFLPGIARLGRSESLLGLIAPARLTIVTSAAVPAEVHAIFARHEPDGTDPRTMLDVVPADSFAGAISRFVQFAGYPRGR